MTKLKDLTGKTFGRLTVISHSHFISTNTGTRHYWNCECSCGNSLKVRGYALKTTKSCGCLQRDTVRALMTVHGDCTGYEITKEYQTWYAMKDRCTNEVCKEYHNYGGRGIRVCERWMKYQNFIADMGRAPSKKHSIERCNNEGNYEPRNCKWATDIEQVYNRRNTLLAEYRGEIKPVKIWCQELGLSYARIRDRIRTHGYSVEDAFEKQKWPNRSHIKK